MGLLAGIVGAGISAIGTMEAAQAQSANASYQAQVARNNAQIAQENSTMAIQSGEAQAAAQGQKARAQVGGIVAAQGANNVDVNTGSAANVRTSSQELANVDTRTIMSNAAKQSFGYQVAASSDTAQAGLDTQEASQAQTAGGIGSLGSFLSGISSVGPNWVKYQNLGTGATSAGANPNVGAWPWTLDTATVA
jgi:hypothetical protein